MIRSYFKTAFRSLLKNKSFSFLNIIGLAVGMAACLLIYQYVSYERSYDKFHTNWENIYRIQYNTFKDGELRFECAAAVPAVGPFMKERLPEIEDYARAFPVGGVLSRDNINFRERRVQIVTPSFLTLFDWGMIKGDAANALNEPYKVVLTESTALKYFGEEDPIGKSLLYNGEDQVEVTGVVKDVPGNSHIKFDVLISFETLNVRTDRESETNWGWYDFNTYVAVRPGTDVIALQEKFDEALYRERSATWEERGYSQAFLFQKMSDIHLYSNLLQESEPEENGDGNSIYFLSLIALLILIIAWVNYINLSTARSLNRAKEVGIRKVVGAFKKQLIYQFLTEALVTNLIAALIAVLIFLVALPRFNELAQTQISFDWLISTEFWLGILLLLILGTLFSGLYPAFIISSNDPAAVLKGNRSTSRSGVNLRKTLVVFQFFASVFLITGTIIVYEQLRFMKNKDLGVDIYQTLVVRGPNVIPVDSLYNGTMAVMRNKVLQIPNIKAVTSSSNVPGNEIFWTRSLWREEEPSSTGQIIYIASIDQDYVPSFDLELVAGRNFDESYGTDDRAVLLNEAGIRMLNFPSPEEAINRKVNLGGEETPMTIIGVLKNYNQMSLKNAVAPILYRFSPASQNFIAIKLATQNINTTLAAVEGEFRSFFPGNPFDYFFLDEFFNRQYEKDQQFGTVFSIFSLLAIFVACLGLFGLIAFSAAQRTKEIGIRKVLGAGVGTIIRLMTFDFLKLIGIAIVLAWPFTYWIMQNWLDGFAYRLTMSPFYFVFAAVLVLLIAMLTTFYKTLITARTNPVKALRYE